MTDIVEQEPEKGKAGRPLGSKGKVKVIDKSSFLRQGKHELDDIIKKTSKELQAMVDVLVEVASNKKGDPKERRMAAEALLGYHTKAVDQRNKDEITRKIAEIKIRGSNGNGSTEDDDDTPQLDFDNIHPDFRDTQVIDMEDIDKES